MPKPKKAATLTKPALSSAAVVTFAEGGGKSKDSPKSGQVPTGDVRLTANIRADLHTKLKIHAVVERTTIGEVLEKLISSLK